MIGVQSKVGPLCKACKDTPCIYGYLEGIPEYCPAAKFPKIIETTREAGKNEQINKILISSRKVAMPADRGYAPRIEEGILFAKELGAQKVGLAACIGFMTEAKRIAEIYEGAGLEVFLVSCHVGGIHLKEWNVPEAYWGPRPTGCNPMAQAEILNQLETEINFMAGFCIGCDALFTKRAQALSTTLVAKDKVTGHNPCVVLYDWYHRDHLYRKYCDKETKFV